MKRRNRPIRRRILIITRNLPPLVGGMERLNWHMAGELAKHAEVRVIGPEGAAATAPPGVNVHEVRLKPLSWFLVAALWRALRLARIWRPQTVLAGSGLTAPLAWVTARTCGARALAYLHGLDITVDHPVYRALWIPAIRRVDAIIANSSATEKLAIDAGVLPDRIGIVHPGVELPQTPLDSDAGRQFRTKHGLGDRPILLSVGRLTRRKGLYEFVRDVLPKIIEHHPNAMLLIVGDAPSKSLHAEAQTPASIQAIADDIGIGAHIRFLGVIIDRDQLAAVYQAADVHVFPVREIPNDPEGFGMVAVEAAAHGLPTVAYATGGVVDAVAEGKSGHLIAPNDYGAFANTVLHAFIEREVMRTSCVDFAQRFSWAAFSTQIPAQLPSITTTVSSARTST